MQIAKILFYLLLLVLNSCNSNNNDPFKKDNKSAGLQQVKSRKKRDSKQGESQQEKITLTSEEEKIFNSLVTAFKYTIEKLKNEIQGCNNGDNAKCNNFFAWLSKDIQKQKEVTNAFTKVYNFLESKKQSKASNENFDTYIKGAIDCKTNNQQDCNKDNKYGSGNGNEIEQYFRGMAGSIFDNKNDNDEIYKCLKEELLKENSHYAGLTTNWKN
ncbi:Mlp family lipoprotein [Borreliella lanei]|uniref:Putative S18 family serine protease n=1 Tax=Borreliella lanei TaxID=373540 RepID=A0A7X0DK39_9SPIR|nr:Mlp family lipoprotein [Borreliella lanei]MBB6208548.1 putative S18 family serine protease [Borreliella lanei]